MDTGQEFKAVLRKNLYRFHGEFIIEFLEAISNRSYFWIFIVKH